MHRPSRRSLISRPAFYEEERVDSLEVGMKSDLNDNRLRLNLVAFHQWWDGIQRNIQSGGPTTAIQRTENVDDSYVYGFEAEINAILATDSMIPGDMFRVDGSLGIAKSGYDSEYFASGTDLSDREFGAPHKTAFLGAVYEHPFAGNGGEMRWRLSYFWREGWASEGVIKPGLPEYNDHNVLDASVRYSSADGRWFVEAFGKNITWDEYYVARVRFSAAGAGWGLGNPGDPRAFGVTVGFEN